MPLGADVHDRSSLHYLLEIPPVHSYPLTCPCVSESCMQMEDCERLCTNNQTSQLHTSTPMTHIGDVFVPLPWFQARYRREHAHKSAPSLPLVENLLKDNTDGCALTALLHFYCPQAIRLEGGVNL